MVYRVVKRGADLLFSLVGLVILSPIFLVLIWAIRLDSKGPILFKQKRVGIHKSYLHGNKVYTELYGAKTA